VAGRREKKRREENGKVFGGEGKGKRGSGLISEILSFLIFLSFWGGKEEKKKRERRKLLKRGEGKGKKKKRFSNSPYNAKQRARGGGKKRGGGKTKRRKKGRSAGFGPLSIAPLRAPHEGKGKERGGRRKRERRGKEKLPFALVLRGRGEKRERGEKK